MVARWWMAALALALVGCSETGLRSWDGLDSDAPQVREPREPSIWDDLDPGSVPDLTFAVLWHDVTGVVAHDESDGRYPCTPGSRALRDVFGDPQVSLMDTRGQLIADVELPEPISFFRAFLVPDGPESFLVEASTLDGSGESQERVTWRVDARTLQVEELLRHPFPARHTYDSVQLRGETVALPDWTAWALPAVIDDRIFLALDPDLRVTSEGPDTPALLEFDAGGSTQVRSWTFAELLPPGVLDDPEANVTLRHVRAADGQLVFTVYGRMPDWSRPDSELARRDYRFVFDPDASARSWTLDLGYTAWRNELPPVHHHAFTRATLLSGQMHTTLAPELRVVRNSGPPVVLQTEEPLCAVGTVVLDPEGPTVVYTNHDADGPDDYATGIVYNHRGQDVLRLDGLKVGLSDRRTHVASMVQLREP